MLFVAGPGKCFRMYSQKQYDTFRPFSLPEVQRVRLESVVLQVRSACVGQLRTGARSNKPLE